MLLHGEIQVPEARSRRRSARRSREARTRPRRDAQGHRGARGRDARPDRRPFAPPHRLSDVPRRLVDLTPIMTRSGRRPVRSVGPAQRGPAGSRNGSSRWASLRELRAGAPRSRAARAGAALGNVFITLGHLPRPVVVIADELVSVQALAIDREKVLAFATETGQSGVAHRDPRAAPRHPRGDRRPRAHEGCGSARPRDHRRASKAPSSSIRIAKLSQRYAKVMRNLARERPLRRRGSPQAVTTSGRRRSRMKLQCNIDMTEGAHDLVEAGFSGVGLFRTEFLYLGRESSSGPGTTNQPPMRSCSRPSGRGRSSSGR